MKSKTADTDGTIIEFMQGSHSYDGIWFGEPHPILKGQFWWRTILREYLSSGKFHHPVPDEAGEVYSRKQLEDAHIVGYTKGRMADKDSDSIYQDAVNYATSIQPAITLPLPKEEEKACMYYYPLFKFFSDEHSLSLLDSEIQEIIIAVEMFNISKLSPVPPSGEDAGKGWISVVVNVPPNEPHEQDLENTPYLTFPHYIILRYYDGHFWKYNSKWDTDVKHFPTHWMPLPLPPKP